MAAGNDNRWAATRSSHVGSVSVIRATVLSVHHLDLAERQADIALFLAANPGVDIAPLRPRAYPSYTYLPGQECGFCHGDRDGGRCLLSPECRFRYRAGFFTRQGGLCPWCGEPLPGHLGMAWDRGMLWADVAIDHIIPVTRGGPVRAEWNKQLLHKNCNSSKGNRVAAEALALAAGHGTPVLDFLAVCEHPAPMPPGAVIHLLPPLRSGKDGYLRSPLARIGYRFRALCGRNLGVDWFSIHGSLLSVTCERCQYRRAQLGPGNTPACPGLCCRA
jgi:hypothetical protein